MGIGWANGGEKICRWEGGKRCLFSPQGSRECREVSACFLLHNGNEMGELEMDAWKNTENYLPGSLITVEILI